MDQILHKWYKAKKKLELLEEKINKYKKAVIAEMNTKNVDKIAAGEFSVTRRRNTRSYLTKESVPAEIWQQYSSKSHYDAFFLTKVD